MGRVINTDKVNDPEKYRRGWTGGLPETECGYGATLSATIEQREWLAHVFDRYEIRSIADIGAGDLNWVRTMDLDGIDYQPFDLVPRHESVTQFDVCHEIPPAVDCILCLWVLNHMPYGACELALDNLKASGARYLVMTDRVKWHSEQPPGILMDAIESLTLNKKGDRILLARL